MPFDTSPEPRDDRSIFPVGHIRPSHAAARAAETWADAQDEPLDWADVVADLVTRHATGAADTALNGQRRVSTFTLHRPETRFIVTTDPERATTTVQLADER